MYVYVYVYVNEHISNIYKAFNVLLRLDGSSASIEKERSKMNARLLKKLNIRIENTE